MKRLLQLIALTILLLVLTACPDDKVHKDSSDTHSGKAPADGKLPDSE